MTLLTEKAETEILKTDVLGRVWTPKDKREALVAEYERSAMSAAECNAPLEVGQPFVLFRLPFCISFDGIQLVICS